MHKSPVTLSCCNTNTTDLPAPKTKKQRKHWNIMMGYKKGQQTNNLLSKYLHMEGIPNIAKVIDY